MIKANKSDKDLVVEILTESFQTNRSVNFVVKQDFRRIKRIRSLMRYSFDICTLFGEIFLSDCRSSCALLIYPEKKRSNVRSIILDAFLAFSVVGVSNIRKVLERENFIKKIQPKGRTLYLWFIGTLPEEQQKGIGSRLLEGLIAESSKQGRDIYLETSVAANVIWYKKYGFEVYHEHNFTYPLYFLKKSH